jgi:diacylglycerol kinase family enzyme
VIGGLRRVFDRPMHIRLRLDQGDPFERTARTVLVANVGRLQGGIDLFGDAQPDDGRLDVAVLKPRGLGGWLSVAASVLLRRQPRRRHLEVFRASLVEVQSRTKEPREMDGDTLEPGRRLTASIQRGALTVCVP